MDVAAVAVLCLVQGVGMLRLGVGLFRVARMSTIRLIFRGTKIVSRSSSYRFDQHYVKITL